MVRRQREGYSNGGEGGTEVTGIEGLGVIWGGGGGQYLARGGKGGVTGALRYLVRGRQRVEEGTMVLGYMGFDGR